MNESSANRESRTWLWWFVAPCLVTVASIVFALGFYGRWPDWSVVSLVGLWLLGMVFFLVTMITWFVKKKPKAGWGALLCLILGGLAIVPAGVIGYFQVMASEMAGGDDFAVNLELPENVDLQEPRRTPRNVAASPDPFQGALLKSLETPGTSDASVVPSIPSLAKMNRDHPELLRRYLSAHPGWWYYIEGRSAYAVRRWKIDGSWTTNRNGYFSRFPSSPEKGDTYQTRTCLCMDGKSWLRGPGRRRMTILTSGLKQEVSLGRGNSMHDSYVSWDEGGILVQIMEQGTARERRITKATSQELEQEFAALLANPTWEQAKTLLPDDAILVGEDQFFLAEGRGGGGIYQANICCNPGEPGRLYLKAYEITRNTPLSERRLKDRSSELAGWSDDPQEKFWSRFQFTIYEGDWGQYYGARFEVWFEPEKGGPDRKLMESNWKIEGWTR